MPSQLAAVRVPTLGIVGSADPAFKDFNELKQFMPQLQLVIINGASHVEAPRRPEFIQALVMFLQEHPLRNSRQP
jgi:pimeloyl-ACP methyl ester carboxylesterase